MKTGTCTTCRTPGPIRAKNLCPSCYTRAWRAHRDGTNPATSAPHSSLPNPGRPPIVRSSPPLDLGTPKRGDQVIIDRLRAGRPAHATHPDDRALVIDALRAGHIGRHTAMKALRCSTTALNATLDRAA